MQRNWLRTNDINVTQDFADILRELDIRDLWDEDDHWRSTPTAVRQEIHFSDDSA